MNKNECKRKIIEHLRYLREEDEEGCAEDTRDVAWAVLDTDGLSSEEYGSASEALEPLVDECLLELEDEELVCRDSVDCWMAEGNRTVAWSWPEHDYSEPPPCPCCKRTFTDLARHMHTQHPDYANAE